MTERDRMIELLLGIYNDNKLPLVFYFTEEEAEFVADKLLEAGVIVPPCKVGDVVYCLDDIREGEAVVFSPLIVKQIFIDVRGCKVYAEGAPWSAVLRPNDFGKTVFLTREEAEQVLKERSEHT